MTRFWNEVQRIATASWNDGLLTAALLTAFVAASVPAADFELGPSSGTMITEGEAFPEDNVLEGAIRPTA